MAVNDLQACAKLLSHMMLDTENNQKPPSGHNHATMLGSKVKKEKLMKGKLRKGNGMVRKKTAKSEAMDEDIQRMIRIKRAQEAHPVINDKDKMLHEIPERDTGGKDTSGLHAPYNQRLSSSTPTGTPVKKIAGKASVKGLLKGDIEEHALNSFEFIHQINPPVSQGNAPQLKKGFVDFQANPHQSFPPRSAFMQQHLQGMREAYMQNLQPRSSSHYTTGHSTAATTTTTASVMKHVIQPAVHHHHQQPSNPTAATTTTKYYMEGLPSTMPTPVVLSGGTIIPNSSQPVYISTGPVGTYAYNLPPAQSVYNAVNNPSSQQPLYTSQAVYIQSSQPPPPQPHSLPGQVVYNVTTGQPVYQAHQVPISSALQQPQMVYREPAEKETAQYSLYSAENSKEDVIGNKDGDKQQYGQTDEGFRGLTGLPGYRPILAEDLPSHIKDLVIESANHTAEVENDVAGSSSTSRKPAISPFKAPQNKSKPSGHISKQSTHQLTRAEILQNALKIALDENGFIKSGPISPFKPGTGGFSGFVQNSDSGEIYREEDLSDLIKGHEEIGVQTEGVMTMSEDLDSTLVESNFSKENTAEAVAQVQGGKKSNAINTKSTSTTAVLTKGAGSTEGRKVMTKNKKVQFIPGGKKTKDTKLKKNLNHGAKVTKSVATSGKDTENKALVTKKSKKAALSNSEVTHDDNKENLKPAAAASEAADDADVDYTVPTSPIDPSKYTSLMKKLQHLVKELKLASGAKLDKEGKRLLKEVDDVTHTATVNWQTDLDLTVQPLRSENAQLRRKIRIFTQQMRDKERQLQEAEKPDQGFMVVHLQMKVYNLENETKALRQLNSKLKEEVKAYLLELERLSAERGQILNLFGTKDAALISTIARTSESDRTGKDGWQREKVQLSNEVELLNINYQQKQAELTKTQELVRNLQGSMSRLLEELQTSKPCPEASLTRLNHELQEVEAIMEETKNQAEESQQQQQWQADAAVRTSARQLLQTDPGRMRQVRSVSEDRSGVLQSDTEKATRGSLFRSHSQRREVGSTETRKRYNSDDDRNPPQDFNHYSAANFHQGADNYRYGSKENQKKTYENARSATEKNQTEDYKSRQHENYLTAPARDNYRSTNTAVSPAVATTPRSAIPSTNPMEKVGLFLMDEPGLNYKKMAESLSDVNIPQRVSLCPTNQESDVTEYHIYPGMSPLMKGQPFEKLDPFIKSLMTSGDKKRGSSADRNPTANQNKDHNNFEFESTNQNIGSQDRFKSPSEPVMTSQYNTHKGENVVTGSRYASASMDPLSPLHSKGYLPKDNMSRASDSRETVSSAPTVKELLTPIADRMERFKNLSDVDSKSRAVRAINFDNPGPPTTSNNEQQTSKKQAANKQTSNPNRLVATDLDDTYDMDLEGDLDKLQYEISSEDDGSTTFSERSDVPLHQQQQFKKPFKKANVVKRTQLAAADESRTISESRYSVTDYFNKYPRERKPIEPASVQDACDTRDQISEDDFPPDSASHNQLKLDLSGFEQADDDRSDSERSGSLINVYGHIEGLDPPPGMDAQYWADKVVISPHGIPMIFDDSNDEDADRGDEGDDETTKSTDFNSVCAVLNTHRSLHLPDEESLPGDQVDGSGVDGSPQVRLYRDTDLDTSLSSINDTTDAGSTGTGATTTSISSVDDRVFRQGLANLDANIARVQQSLRQKMY